MNSNSSVPYFDICHRIIRNMLNNENDIQNCMTETQNALDNIIDKETLQLKSRIARQIASSRAIYSHKNSRQEIIYTLTISSILEELDEVSTLKTEASSENIISLQVSDTLDKYIHSLPLEEISIYVKRYFYAESINNIAKSLNTTEQKIKQVLQHCNQGLNRLLSDKGYIVSSETLFLSFTDIDDDIIDLNAIQNIKSPLGTPGDSNIHSLKHSKRMVPFIIAFTVIAVIIVCLLIIPSSDGNKDNKDDYSNVTNIDKRFLHIFETRHTAFDFVNIAELLKYKSENQTETGLLPINCEHFKIKYRKIDLMDDSMLQYCVGELFDDTSHDNRVYFKLLGHDGLQYVIQKEFDKYSLYELDNYKVLNGKKDVPFSFILKEIFNINASEDIQNLSYLFYDCNLAKNIDSPEDIDLIYQYIQAVTSTGNYTETQLKDEMYTTSQLLDSSTLLTITSADGETCHLWYRYDHQYFYDFSGPISSILDEASHESLKTMLGFPDTALVPKYNPYKPETWNIEMKLDAYSADSFVLKFVHPYSIETVDLQTNFLYDLEKYVDGSWIPMERVIPESSVEAKKELFYTIPKNKPYYLGFSFTKEYVGVNPGKLEPGRYRISKTVINKNLPENSDGALASIGYTFTVEFEITEETETSTEEIKYGN